ncbi:hypothetical protein PHYSODRAFT_334111 [Phytophthora sojae]|uniref:FLYWCH-type domain-containing protein n=1 Tax=Phytophthora sojae (strain P6497) TaxID=1094619 RepID=G4ZKG4_PHYSP|nr:hypothetical protein PHYSODRAFT_334111 [Phytophthora sojae]EGZ15906.1 hypothetical protein PHYSODRAFT_334111 [Phytophthora sojae]|eukprot:XP_009529655.1 hypothetical protein PHYSODRAFT_334111 [Phytophthora sojae]
MRTTTASTPTSSSHHSDGEFDQQWEFGFNSDRGGASASNSDADSDAVYISPVYGDREPCFSSDDDSDDEDSPAGTPPRDIEVDDDSVSSGGSSVSTQGDVTRLPGGLVLGSSRYDMDDSEASSCLDDSDAYDPEVETVSSEDEGDELAVQPSASGRQVHAGIDLVATAHRTVIQLNGHQYTKARESSRKISFRCSFYRRTPGCKGKVDYSFARDVFYNFTPHTCEGTGQAPSRYVDVTEEMKAEVDRLSIRHLSHTAQQISLAVREQLFVRDDSAVVQGLTRHQVRQHMYRTRRVHFGGNVHGMVKVAPQSLVQGTTLNFFQFHHVFTEDERLQRVLGWADARLLELLRYPG